MNKAWNKVPVLLSLLVATLVVGIINWLAFSIFRVQPPLPTNAPFLYVTAQLVGLAITLFFLIGGFRKVFVCERGSFRRGLLLGWPFIAVAVITGLLTFFVSDKTAFVMPDVEKLIGFLLIMLLVGTVEEILFRGIILNRIMDKYGSNKKGVFLSVLTASFIFGLAHIVNVIIQPQMKMFTLTQIIYCTLAGLLFCAIYLRCRNIYAMIFLHALVDVCSIIFTVFYPQTQGAITLDTGIPELLTYVAAHIPLAIIALIYLRRYNSESRSVSEPQSK